MNGAPVARCGRQRGSSRGGTGVKRIEMIGTPLDHVRSPGILNPMFRAAGEAVEVVTREVNSAALSAYVDATRGDADVLGLLVTTPLKQAILPFVDRLSELADFIGAVNCVRFDGGSWFGANVDGFGFDAALAAAGADAAGKRVLLCGCGGAGTAIAASLMTATGIALSLYDIDRRRAEDLAARLASFAPRATVEALAEPVGRFDIVINASTVGMAADDPSPLPEEIVAGAEIVADIVTMPDTRLKEQARRHGRQLVVGDAMVAAQAELFLSFFLSDTESERELIKNAA